MRALMLIALCDGLKAMSGEVRSAAPVTLALCGDVMTGRGIDQILAHPGNPRLYEPHLKSALEYVTLAERANGPIERPVDSSYIWGEAIDALRAREPDAFIVNLETAITLNERPERKGINYRMNPANIDCLAEAGIDCCVLANNHALDWGTKGLTDTLSTLSRNQLRFAGAGLTARDASAAAIIDLGARGRVLIFGMASPDCGVSRSWAAMPGKPGVNLLPDLSARRIKAIANVVRPVKRPNDIAVASIHWGSNWGYEVRPEQRRFAHALIDEAQMDVVHGHSSHHPKAIEIHGGKPIIYGCGDFVDDYEGISGYEEFRPDLVVLYFLQIELARLAVSKMEFIPFRIRRFRLERPGIEDTLWLVERLGRECARFDIELHLTPGGSITARWQQTGAAL